LQLCLIKNTERLYYPKKGLVQLIENNNKPSYYRISSKPVSEREIAKSIVSLRAISTQKINGTFPFGILPFLEFREPIKRITTKTTDSRQQVPKRMTLIQ
jgi:hypothetical protein